MGIRGEDRAREQEWRGEDIARNLGIRDEDRAREKEWRGEDFLREDAKRDKIYTREDADKAEMRRIRAEEFAERLGATKDEREYQRSVKLEEERKKNDAIADYADLLAVEDVPLHPGLYRSDPTRPPSESQQDLINAHMAKVAAYEAGQLRLKTGAKQREYEAMLRLGAQPWKTKSQEAIEAEAAARTRGGLQARQAGGLGASISEAEAAARTRGVLQARQAGGLGESVSEAEAAARTRGALRGEAEFDSGVPATSRTTLIERLKRLAAGDTAEAEEARRVLAAEGIK